jgi:hypothetical protein
MAKTTAIYDCTICMVLFSGIEASCGDQIHILVWLHFVAFLRLLWICVLDVTIFKSLVNVSYLMDLALIIVIFIFKSSLK